MKRSFFLISITGSNTVAVFLYQWWIINQFGIAPVTDSLFAGMVVPQLVLNVISGSLGYVLVPMLAANTGNSKTAAIWTFATALTIVFSAIAIILWISAPFWVDVILPGFNSVMRRDTIELTRIQLIGVVFSGLGAPFNAAFQARNRFIDAASISLVSTVISLIYLMTYLTTGGIKVAAWGLTIRAIVQLGLQLPIAFPYQKPDFQDLKFEESIKNLKPLIFGTIYYKTDQVIDKYFGSLAQPGSLSLFHLAQQIYSAIAQVILYAFAAPAVPTLARDWEKKDYRQFKNKFRKNLSLLSLIGLSGILMVAIFGRRLMDLSSVSGYMIVSHVDEFWLMMLALGSVWVFGLTGQVLANTFYAMTDTRTPTSVGVVGFTIGILLKGIGFYAFGLLGVAGATGLYTMLNTVVMYLLLERRFASLERVSGEFGQ